MPGREKWVESINRLVGRDNLLETIFKQASNKFSTEMTKDGKKRDFACSLDTIDDVKEAVKSSMARYASNRKVSAASRWLVCFSQRIKFYGEILDVLAQHHPEYVSLAWGAMKFLFTVSVSIPALQTSIRYSRNSHPPLQ